ncbi:hypothetical protein DPMN_055854 [Dreissena polymorpha]|uniref:Uncharacterized protein n=1 Tax=Dreissena polymorpha TaxID=45954 RepID=A0A9D4CTE7_DREPO|nr:hypothetical protein DPMN_055854 [Dreissena polymorpha]
MRSLPGGLGNLFRVLRLAETPALGLFARNLYAFKSIQSHVGCGGRPNYSVSEYISTSASLTKVLDFASLKAKNDAEVVIVEIDVGCLRRHGIPIVDLRDATKQQLPE